MLYCRYSRYTINWDKSLIYVLHWIVPRLPRECTARVVTEGFHYLAIYITGDPDAFYEYILVHPLASLQSDFQHVKTVRLLLLGKVSLFKMMALPCFLYVLQNTPYAVPPSYFQAVDTVTCTLLGDGAPTRIFLPKWIWGWYDGRIVLPALQQYYWLAQLIVNQWVHLPEDEPTYRMDWQNMRTGVYLGTIYGGGGGVPHHILISDFRHASRMAHCADDAGLAG